MKYAFQSTMYCLGFFVIFGEFFGVAKDVRPAYLLGTARLFSKLVVRWKSVVHDKFAGLILQDWFDYFVTPSAMYFVPRHFFVYHTPDPVI